MSENVGHLEAIPWLFLEEGEQKEWKGLLARSFYIWYLRAVI